MLTDEFPWGTSVKGRSVVCRDWSCVSVEQISLDVDVHIAHVGASLSKTDSSASEILDSVDEIIILEIVADAFRCCLIHGVT